MRFFFDGRSRHLVCWPYSPENLHIMALQLGIKRCWYHAGRLAHYDVPKRDIGRIAELAEVVSSRTILDIVKGLTPPQTRDMVQG